MRCLIPANQLVASSASTAPVALAPASNDRQDMLRATVKDQALGIAR